MSQVSRSSRRRQWPVAAAMALLVSSGTLFGLDRAAHADATPVPPAAADAEQIASAKRHFQQAIALYNDGNFEAALSEFLAAYRTKPAPSILYNIGLTYKSLFLYNDSIRSLEQFLHDDPTMPAERRTEVEQILRETRALLADVTLAISPEGAQVKVDGRIVGRAPIGKYLIATGRHVLEVSADGYVTQTKEVMATAGVPMALAISLVIIPKSGHVRATVSPANAGLKVDGKAYPPPIDLELPLGGHTLEGYAPGYVTYREEVLVAAGQSRDIQVVLHKTPIYKRAALWVPLSIGIVLVAGGITAGVLCGALHDCESPVIVGSLNPGSANVGR